MEDNENGFFDFVMEHDLTREKGSLFSYLSRVMKTAMLFEVTQIGHFEVIEQNIRQTFWVESINEYSRRVNLASTSRPMKT